VYVRGQREGVVVVVGESYQSVWLWDVGGRKEGRGRKEERGKEDIPALASAGPGPQTTTT
jgi:hypothetical protein